MICGFVAPGRQIPKYRPEYYSRSDFTVDFCATISVLFLNLTHQWPLLNRYVEGSVRGFFTIGFRPDDSLRNQFPVWISVAFSSSR